MCWKDMCALAQHCQVRRGSDTAKGLFHHERYGACHNNFSGKCHLFPFSGAARGSNEIDGCLQQP